MQSETPSKKELNNLRIRGRIVRRIYDNPDCNITFIIKGKGITKNLKSLRKRIAELQKTDYFQTLIPWHEECFHIYLKNDPDFLSFRTFCRTKNDLSIFCDSNDCIKNSNAYKEFIELLKVESLYRTAKHHFRTIPIEYHYKLKLDKDIQEQVLRKLFSTYHKKILLYLRVEYYNKKHLKPRIQLDITRRIEGVTEFIFKYFEDFAKKIDTPEFEEYVWEQLVPNLDLEHKATEMVLNFAMEDLTTIVTHEPKFKRKIRTQTERIDFWQSHLDEYFDPENPRNVPNSIMRVLKPIMKKDETPDFAKMTLIDAVESGRNVLFAENYKTDEFFWQWSERYDYKYT